MKYILVWLLALAGSYTMNASDKAWVLSESVVDVCAEPQNREVIISLHIGEVLKSDSLYGFNFEIRYDTTKIRFESYLKIGTLTEFFEWSDASFGVRPGIITGFAAIVSPSRPPVYGNRPLMAFKGVWRTDCADTSMIDIVYMEFTDEYKGNIKEYISDTVKAFVFDKPERNAQVTFEKDTVSIAEDSTEKIKVLLNVNSGNRINNLTLDLSGFNKSRFDAINIESPNTDIVNINTINISENLIHTEVEILEELVGLNEIMEISLKRKKGFFDTLDFRTDLKIDFNCDCITRIENDNLLVLLPKRDTTDTTDTSTSVIDYKEKVSKLHSYRIENSIYCSIENELISDIILYDINGVMIKQIRNYKIESKVEIDIESLTNGVYFILAETNNGIKYKNIFIKY